MVPGTPRTAFVIKQSAAACLAPPDYLRTMTDITPTTIANFFGRYHERQRQLETAELDILQTNFTRFKEEYLTVKEAVLEKARREAPLSLDEEWWGELVGSKAETVTVHTPAPSPMSINVKFPVIVQAGNDPSVTAQLINHDGPMIYNGRQYTSLSVQVKTPVVGNPATGGHFGAFRTLIPDNGKQSSTCALFNIK